MEYSDKVKELQEQIRQQKDLEEQEHLKKIKKVYTNPSCDKCLYSIILHEGGEFCQFCDKGSCVLCRNKEVCEDYKEYPIPEKRKFLEIILENRNFSLEELTKLSIDELEQLSKLLRRINNEI